MKIAVSRVNIPAMSTIGYGYGEVAQLDFGDNGDAKLGQKATFVGDHRPMRDLGEALRTATEPIEVEVENYQLLGPILREQEGIA